MSQKDVSDLIFRRVANVLLDQVLPPHVNDCLTIGVAIMPDQEEIDVRVVLIEEKVTPVCATICDYHRNLPSVVVRVDFWEVKLVVIGLCLWSIVLPRGGKGLK